jgi:uncharacterized protein (DUF1800 family)
VPLAFAAALAACGGGGGGSGGSGSGGSGGGGGDPALSLAPKAVYTEEDLLHFLTRTHFGIRPAELDAVRAAGLPAYVDAMLELPAPGASPADQQAASLILQDPENDPQGLFPTAARVARWWLYLMQHTTTPFQEVVAMFWHGHFAASSEVLPADQMVWMVDHVNLWRGGGMWGWTGPGAGTWGRIDLRELCLRMARDGVMLEWLDGIRSTNRAPNENFCREFWELFLLGRDEGYTQADILEGSRAFTGWRRRDGGPGQPARVEFDPLRHDPGPKVVFGQTIPGQNLTDDFAAMVNLTLDHRPVAEWIARKILEHFCRPDPPPALVQGLAKVLRDAGYDLAPVFRTLLLSEAFHAAPSRECFVKSPVEHAIGFLRSTGLHVPILPRAPGATLDGLLTALGQRPTQPPSVDGWPGGERWLNAQGMIFRANVVQHAITARAHQAASGIAAASLLPAPDATAPQVVDALLRRLRVTASPSERQAYETYLGTSTASGSPIPDPWNPANANHVDERLRGLLYILAQHPTYARR